VPDKRNPPVERLAVLVGEPLGEFEVGVTTRGRGVLLPSGGLGLWLRA
jgi:hypothetical protein